MKIATMERVLARDAATSMLEDPGLAACLFEGEPWREVRRECAPAGRQDERLAH